MRKESQPRSYYIESLGCAKNQVDSETIMAELEGDGFLRVVEPAEADLIVVNTCAFIESAKAEAIETILAFKKLYPGKKISVRGCLSVRYKKELGALMPEIDELLGAPETEAFLKGSAGKAPSGERPLLSAPGTAYIKISEGCSNSCAFCAVPLIRGALVSRSIDSVKDEASALLRRGIREITLIAQDTGSFGLDRGRAELPALLEALSRLKGDFWLRFLYTHPDRLLGKNSFLAELLTIMKNDPRILPYFDLPIQHASASLLTAIGREGGAEAYLALIDNIRSELPRAAVRSTFLVGFPGETEADFAVLLDFQKKACFDWLGIFAYSREEGTPAYFMKKRPSKKTALLRKTALEEAQESISAKRMKLFEGWKTRALIEEEILQEDGSPRLYLGRLPIHAPEVDGAAVIESGVPLSIGSFVTVTTLKASGLDLRCKVDNI